MRAGPYGAALRTTLRQTAAAYGYTLSIATTAAVLSSARGKPHTADLFLFLLGGTVAFALLEALLHVIPQDRDAPDRALPFAGVLNLASATAGLGAGSAIAHAGVSAGAAWLLAPMGATASYLAVLALQVTLVDRVRP